MPDQYAANDVARLEFSGSNGSTTFTDALAHPFTGGVGATNSTLMARYGTGSLLLSGAATAYIQSVSSADWNMGAGDFSVDAFVYATTISRPSAIVVAIGDKFTLTHNATGRIVATIKVAGITHTLSPGTSVDDLDLRRWHHLAYSRSGTNHYLWLNGNLIASASNLGTGAVDWASDVLFVGGNGLSVDNAFTGNIDCVRVTKGVARYIKPFIPPLSGFDTTSSNTFLSTLGPNTKQVSVVDETNLDAVILATDAAITSLGWAQYDCHYRGGFVTMVYRALNRDGATYKYAMVIWSKAARTVCLTCCESWDAQTHVPTNEAWTGYRSIQMGVFHTNTDIVIFGTSRYLGMCTYVLNSQSITNFVIEVEREAAEDTVGNGACCWGNFNSATWGVSHIVNIEGDNIFNMPRTQDGRTGSAAVSGKYQTLQTATGASGWQCTSNQKFAELARSNNTSSFPMKHGWDTSKNILSSLKFITGDNAGTYSIYGRLFGIKAASPMGNQMDKVTIPVDSDMFYSNVGTPTEHWVLNSTSDFANVYTPTGTGDNPVTTMWPVVLAPQGMCFTGRFVWCGCSAGVFKLDLTTGVRTDMGQSGSWWEMTFDGRYVFGTSATGITRWDTLNGDAVASLTVGVGGGLSICEDGWGRVYVSQRSAATAPQIHAVEPQSLVQVGATINAPTSVGAGYALGLSANGYDTVAFAFTSNTATSSYGGCVNTKTHAVIKGEHTWDTIAGNCGTRWGGEHFDVGFCGNSGASPGFNSHTYVMGSDGNRKLNAITNYGSTAAGSVQGAVRPFRTAICSHQIVPSATAAPGVHTAYGGGLGVPGANYSTATAVGTYNNTSGLRTGLWTGNQLLLVDLSNNLYHVQQIYRPGQNSIKYGQLLIPR